MVYAALKSVDEGSKAISVNEIMEEAKQNYRIFFSDEDVKNTSRKVR